MAKSSPVADALNEALQCHGFTEVRCPGRRGKSWACEKKDIIWFVWLQANKYGKAYFVNLGLHLKAIPHPGGEERYPWHADTRLESEMGSMEAREELEDRLLNLRHRMPEKIRKARLVEIFESDMMPIFASCDTFKHAKKMLLHDQTFSMRKYVKEFLKGGGS
jgi:Domain of unknown function (DUF4304)